MVFVEDLPPNTTEGFICPHWRPRSVHNHIAAGITQHIRQEFINFVKTGLTVFQPGRFDAS